MLSNSTPVRVPVGRFAPSPTGSMHLGNVWCALLSWLSVRSRGGKWVLRIEDLDPDRSRQVYADQLMRDLEWLGLGWDEGPYYQHDRSLYYKELFDQLSEAIYPCFCRRADLLAASAPHATDGRALYAGTCRRLSSTEVMQKMQERTPAWRIHVPNVSICFEDIVFGSQVYSLPQEVGDFVLRRSDGVYAYNLAVVADDYAQGVTEIVRGQDLLTATAPQLWLYDQLGFVRPQYAHVPLVVATDGRRLCKRDAALDLAHLREQGISPQRIVGALGRAAGMVEEPFATLEELIPLFDWHKVPRQPVYITDLLDE